MRDYLLLTFLDRFSFLFSKLGCNYPIMRKILQVKLTLDARRVPTLFQRAKRNEKSDQARNYSLRALVMYGLLGLFLIPFALLQNVFFSMSIVFAIFMFIIMTALIADFSSVLLDIRDHSILWTKPVDKKTLSLARIIHVSYYISQITLAVTVPTLITSLIVHGVLFFLYFIVTLLLMDSMIIAATAFVYMLILRLFDGERLKDIINYVQIALSITLVVGYQFVGRSFSILQTHIIFHTAWWQLFLPPVWFASSFAWLFGSHAHTLLIVMACLAWLVPLAAFWIYVALAPIFERSLQKLVDDSGSRRARRHVFTEIAAKLVCTSASELAIFHFLALMTARERDFKLKVYPSLGLALVLPFVFLLNPAFTVGIASLATSKLYLTIYAGALLTPSILLMLPYSNQHKAAWIYAVTPGLTREVVFKAMIKVVIVRLALPIYLIDAAVFLGIFGIHIIPDLVIVFWSMLIFTMICFWLVPKKLPFSEPFQTGQQSQAITGMFLMLLIAVFAGTHFLATIIPYGRIFYLLLLFIAAFVSFRYGFRFPNFSLMIKSKQRPSK